MYSSRPEFIYYFDPNLDIQTKVDGTYGPIKIGFFEEGKVKLINNLLFILNSYKLLHSFNFVINIIDTKIYNDILFCVLLKTYENTMLHNMINELTINSKILN